MGAKGNDRGDWEKKRVLKSVYEVLPVSVQ